jgi:exopolysaccharide biosynthesis polyprenyl glycosylphosphotransferase
VDGVPLIGLPENPLDRPWNRLLKRLEDIVIGACILILSSPVLLLSMLWIRLDSKGPIFYKQERCGRGGEVFTFFKLRTMRTGAEQESGPVWAVPDDPRCTRPGRILRRLNIDELPQLINVLRGEMSLVGPRPERPFFVEQFRSDFLRYMSRHRATPGMTGWAQVNGLRGQTSIEERLKYDLYYLEHWSLLFDVKILLLTFLAHKNAY